MNDEKLIELVRLHPALYNLGDPKYLDTKFKNYLWRKIARELKLDENDFNVCKSRWTNIRDQYKKYLKNEKTVTGQAATSKKKYKYTDLLLFLKCHDDDRERHSNFSLPQDERVPTENEAAETELTSEILAMDTSARTLNKENEDPSNDSTFLPTTSVPKFIKKRKSTPNVSASQTLLKYVIENNQKKKDENDAIHPIDAFLNGLAPTLKSLSLYNQHVARGQIFQIVHDLERQELLERNYSSSSSSSQHSNSTILSESILQVPYSSPLHQAVIEEMHASPQQQTEVTPNSYTETQSIGNYLTSFNECSN